jgi:hypothetical protein
VRHKAAGSTCIIITNYITLYKRRIGAQEVLVYFGAGNMAGPNPNKHLSLFLSAAIGGAALGVAHQTSADTWFGRHHASKCFSMNGIPVDSNFGIQNDSTTSTLNLICPAIDEINHLKWMTTNMILYGADNSTVAAINAGACRANGFSEGGACGTTVSTGVGSTGTYSLSAVTSGVWTSVTEGDFGYVFVNIPPKQGSVRSTLRGLYQSGN